MSNQTKHTKGPWHVADALIDTDVIGKVVRAETGMRIAAIYDGDYAKEKRDAKANARLIAACPEMHTLLTEAQKRVCCECLETRGDNSNCLHHRIEALLKKVSGQ